MKSAFVAGSVVWVLACTANAGELLGHISDDNAQPITDTKPALTDDRRIIYRVICSPGDEVLPDCEKPIADNEATQAPPVIEQEVSQAETDQEQEAPQKTQSTAKSAASKVKVGNRKTQSAKKSKTSRKSGSPKKTTSHSKKSARSKRGK